MTPATETAGLGNLTLSLQADGEVNPPLHGPPRSSLSVKRLRLPDTHRDELQRQLLNESYPRGDYAAYLRRVTNIVTTNQPEWLHAEIDNFCRHPDAPIALLISNGPQDPHLPPTPTDGRRAPDKKTSVSEGFLAGVTSQCGRLFAYRQEKGDEAIHNIVPTPAGAATQTNAGSTIPLDTHTELGGLVHNPDYIALVCLRQEPDGAAATLLVDGRLLYKELSPRDRWQLQQPQFRFQTPASMGPTQYGPAWPVFRVEQNRLIGLRLALYGMFGETIEAEEALQALRCLVADLAEPILLQPWELLLIDNRLAGHGRAAFQPTFSREERWLQRAMAAARVRDFPISGDSSRVIIS